MHIETHTHNRKRNVFYYIYNMNWKGNNFSRLLPAFFAVAAPKDMVLGILTPYSDEIGVIPWQNGSFLQHRAHDLCSITWPYFGRLRLLVTHSHFILHCTFCNFLKFKIYAIFGPDYTLHHRVKVGGLSENTDLREVDDFTNATRCKLFNVEDLLHDFV